MATVSTSSISRSKQILEREQEAKVVTSIFPGWDRVEVDKEVEVTCRGVETRVDSRAKELELSHFSTGDTAQPVPRALTRQGRSSASFSLRRNLLTLRDRSQIGGRTNQTSPTLKLASTFQEAREWLAFQGPLGSMTRVPALRVPDKSHQRMLPMCSDRYGFVLFHRASVTGAVVPLCHHSLADSADPSSAAMRRSPPSRSNRLTRRCP